MNTISVCIPTCDRLDLLKEAIFCCQQQTRLPDEIVIGDDSLQDVTEEAMVALQRESAVLINYKKNRPRLGQNANINSLFDRASGSHLVLLHDDDLLVETALDDLIACWDLHPDLTGAFGKQYVMSHGGVIDLRASEELNRVYRRTPETAGLQPEPWRVGMSQQFPNDGYMILAEAARAIRWKSKEDVGYGGEFDFGLRLGLTYTKFFILEKYTCKYRLSEGASISSSSKDDAALQSYRIMKSLELPARMEDCRADQLQRSAAPAILQAIRHGQRREAWTIYWSRNHGWRRRLSPGGARRLLLMFVP